MTQAPEPVVRRFLRVQGIVQGVGFRPFVARTARGLGLTGRVRNTTRGVEIEVQGPAGAVDRFCEVLKGSPPPMAVILEVEARDLPPRPGGGAFQIVASREDPAASAVIPPDIATCPACVAELFDPADRRHGYPFINCTDCGPRYTIIRSVPYDRSRTAMAAFVMCERCAAEYADPESRRFHAQPNACPRCGPRPELRGPGGEALDGDPVRGAVEALRAGGIVALLGLGGFHLACDALSEEPVAELRRRKGRPAKPFAVMAADLETARALARLTPGDEALLTSPQAPIVLAPARPGSGLAPSVAPGQDRVGLFLPYTPLHHLVFRLGPFRALVMTSGNRSDEPIVASWPEARERLAAAADRFLVHDRPIVHRVDDSVIKATARGPVLIRRARGYAPAPVPLPNPGGRVVLALGAELASTVCVVRGSYAYPSPHIGDLGGIEVERVYRETAGHLLGLLRVRPDLVVHDLHPGYRSTRWAREWEEAGVEVVAVQHHEAHAAACMAEHGLGADGVALALDGLGYGTDGTLWGGEILVGRPGRFRRAGHLVPVPQPGGDRASREPWRMAAAHLHRVLGPGWRELPLPCFRERPAEDLEVILRMIEQGVNAPLTSSCGRLFDAAAAVLGFTDRMTYPAQAPMELEALAARSPGPPADLPAGSLRHDGAALVMDPGPLVRALAEHALAGRDPGRAALGFHRGLAELLARGAAAVARAEGLTDVYLTGGCMQNGILLEHLCAGLESRGLTPRLHRRLPPNDGGISFGQAAWVLEARG